MIVTSWLSIRPVAWVGCVTCSHRSTPGLERVVDATNKAGLALLTRHVTPTEVRRAGRRRITDHLRGTGGLRLAGIDALVEAALAAVQAQRVAVPGEAIAADLVRELAREALAIRNRLSELDKQIEAILERQPDAALIRSLSGMGATLTAEFLAETGSTTRFATGDQLAAAAGLAPALVQSGKTNYQRRATGGSRALKRVFYQSAFCAMQRHPTSRAFYDRKRSEKKRHHQAVIAPARPRINVLHAILRTDSPTKSIMPGRLDNVIGLSPRAVSGRTGRRAGRAARPTRATSGS